MWRYAVFALMAAALANAQAAGQSSPGFAGCYEVTSLTWSPPGDVKLIPKNLELLNVARGDGSFHMRAVGVETNGMDRFWWWEPKGQTKSRPGGEADWGAFAEP